MSTGVANPARIELAASPPCQDFRPRFIQPAAGAATPADVKSRSQVEVSERRFVIGLILAAALVGFGTEMSMELFNLRMKDAGVAELSIGISVAIQALAIIISALLTKHVISYLGIRKTLLVSALVSSTALIAFGFVADIVLWTLARFIFALGLGLLFTSSESLVISRTNSNNRGRVVGWYATALATGTAAGPLLVMLAGIHGFAPLLCGAAAFALATIPTFAYLKRGEELAPVVRSSTIGTVGIAPIAFLSAFMFGVADNGGVSLLSVYAVMNGYAPTSAVILTIFVTVGAIILQIPVGHYAHTRDPRAVLLACAVGAMTMLTLLPNLIGVKPIAAVTAFALGGFMQSLYTIGLIYLAKYYRGIGISSANGLFISICGFGELIGPLVTGASMDRIGPGGYVVALTIMFAIYSILIVCIRQVAQTRSVDADKARHLRQPSATSAPAR